jgi:hypothetical protein
MSFCYTTKKSKQVPFIAALIFFFSIVSFFSYGYKVLSYDTFEYYSENVLNQNIIGGENCIADGALFCNQGSGYKTIKIPFNLINSSYCISGNGLKSPLSTGKNFSIIFDFTPQLETSTGNGIFYLGIDETIGLNTKFRVVYNDSGLTKYYASTYTNNLIYNITYSTDHTGTANTKVQIDFFQKTQSGYNMNFGGGNVSIPSLDKFIFTGPPSAGGVTCINNTIIKFKDSYFILDNLIVIEYDTGEKFISPKENISDIYSAGLNDFPDFSVSTKDKNEINTNFVYLTSNSCIPEIIPFTNQTTNSECNPLYIRYDFLNDAENNTIFDGLFCGFLSGTGNILEDNFTEAPDINLRDRYNMSCIVPIEDYSFNGENLKGINIPTLSGCTGSIKSRFNNDYPSDYSMLSNLADYILQFDFRLMADKRYNVEFFNNFETPIVLSFVYNSASQKTEIWSGEDIYSLSIVQSTDRINNASPVRFYLALNNNGSKYSYRLSQGENDFYSPEESFYWSSPLNLMLISATQIDVTIPATSSPVELTATSQMFLPSQTSLDTCDGSTNGFFMDGNFAHCEDGKGVTWKNFSISYANMTSIKDINIIMPMYVDADTLTTLTCLKVSWDSGAHYSDCISLDSIQETDVLNYSFTGLYGHTWTPAQLAGLQIRIEFAGDGGGVYYDATGVIITYGYNSIVASDDTFFGTYKISEPQFPAFSEADATNTKRLNCTSSITSDKIAWLFVTDSEHAGNYLNFIEIPWSAGLIQVSAPGDESFFGTNDSGTIGAGLRAMFRNSETLIYIFDFFLMFVTIFVIFFGVIALGGASPAAFMAGAVVSIFAVGIEVFILTLIGFIPIWVTIAIVLLMLIIIGFVVVKAATGGGGGEI